MFKKNSSFVRILLIAPAILLLASACTQTNKNSSAPNSTPTVAAQLSPTPQQTAPVAYSGQQGKSALQILKEKYSVKTSTYSGLGEFVTSINGLAADSKHFWSFYLNGSPAQVGAGNYQTKNSDQIEWKLEIINNSTQ